LKSGRRGEKEGGGLRRGSKGDRKVNVRERTSQKTEREYRVHVGTGKRKKEEREKENVCGHHKKRNHKLSGTRILRKKLN